MLISSGFASVLLFFIKIPENTSDNRERVLDLAKEGLMFLKENPLIMTLILFISGVNLVDAALPGYVIPNLKGGLSVLGIVTSCSGFAMIIGSLIASVLPKPRNRVKVFYLLGRLFAPLSLDCISCLAGSALCTNLFLL